MGEKMALKIEGGKAGSVKRLKKEMEKSQGGQTWIKSLKDQEDMNVRFLTEPEDWYSYREHYSPEVNFFPCIGSDNQCPGCGSDNEKVQRSSRRFLANVLDLDTGRVIPLKLPLDLANRLVARYERYGDTIMDRDYTLHRMGKSLDTTYDVTPGTVADIDVTRYKDSFHDPEEALIRQFEDAFETDDDEKPSEKPSAVPVDDDSDEDNEIPSEPSASPEEEDEDGGYLTEADAEKMTKEELIDLAHKYKVEVKASWSKSALIDAIFDAAAE